MGGRWRLDFGRSYWPSTRPPLARSYGSFYRQFLRLPNYVSTSQKKQKPPNLLWPIPSLGIRHYLHIS